MSEKTRIFCTGSQTGPSVNFMPPASFLTFATGSTSDLGSPAWAPVRTNANVITSAEDATPVFIESPLLLWDQGRIIVADRFCSSNDLIRSSNGMVTKGQRSHLR